MALPTSINVQTAFNLRAATSVFNIIDTTDFNAEGITLSDVKGNYTIVDPLGNIVYQNTSLVTPDIKSFSITSISQVAGVATVVASSHGLSTNDWILVGGAGQAGYNILAQVTVINANQFTYLVNSATVTPATGTLLGLKVSLMAIQIPLDSSTGMPVLGLYTVTLTTTVGGGTQPGTYIKAFTYTYSYVRPVVAITQSVNCFIARFLSYDATTYTVNGIAPTVARTQNITFPAASGIPVATYTSQKVQIDRPKVWNGIYITAISSILSYVDTDGLIILDVVTGSKPFEVSCQDICNINCCLNDANKAYKNALLNGGANSPLTVSKLAIFTRAQQLAGLYQINIQCGNTTDAAVNLQDIQDVTGCTADCNCGNNTGEVIPTDGFIGKTILQWDVTLSNNQFDYINFQNNFFYVLNNTLAGQSPLTNPSLYQQMDLPVWGTITGTLSAQTDLQAALDAKIAKFDQANVVSGANTVTLNKLSGRVTFTDSISSLARKTFTINNSLFAGQEDVRFSIRYKDAAPGVPIPVSFDAAPSVIYLNVYNADAVDPTAYDIEVDFQIMS